MTRNKVITEKDIYYFYPYKKNPPYNGKTIPQPYVKNKEVSDHKFALTYDVWLSVLEDYIEDVQNQLLKGRIVKLPVQLGNLQLKKYKLHKRVDWGETQRTKKKTYLRERDLHSIIIKWDRHRNICKFAVSDFWKIRMGDMFGKKLFDAVCKDHTFVYSIIDI